MAIEKRPENHAGCKTHYTACRRAANAFRNSTTVRTCDAGKDADALSLLSLVIVKRVETAFHHHLLPPVVQLDMGHFVSKHIGKLGLVVQQRHHPGSDV